MDWARVPDVVVVALLTCAFASVAYRGRGLISRLWLAGWLLMVVHTTASIAEGLAGWPGSAAHCIALVTLLQAGVLFGYASVPYRGEASSLWMTGTLLATTTLYAVVAESPASYHWLLIPSAVLLGAAPLSIALWARNTLQHPLRWMIVCLYCALSLYLQAMALRPEDTHELAVHGMLFAIYLGCALHVAYVYCRTTAGALITTAGFVAWAVGFVLQPMLTKSADKLALRHNAWDLPLYVVAVGMILLMLEDQLQQSRYLALHDELTGLPNRRLFLDRLALSIERARRAHQKCALLVVDLNRFKMVNDTLGHHMGDQLLRHVAGVFSARVRSSDTVARTGGDEFSVLLENPLDAASAQLVAEFLLAQLNSPMEVCGRQVRVGASAGVALFPDDAQDMEMLRIAADLRMYANKRDAHKQDGVNDERVLTFPDRDEPAAQRRAAQERTHA